MKLLVATRSTGKIREIMASLAGLDAEVIGLDQVSIGDFEPAETAATFDENAAIKAEAYSQKTQLLTLSDDSGLEIDVLDGLPGVNSKRFIEGSDADRNNHILQLMADKTDRTARFVTVLCLHDPVSQTSVFFRGTLEGAIANQAAGNEGFGYDPIFIPEGYQKTLAEVDLAEKNSISHRAKALSKLRAYFQKNI